MKTWKLAVDLAAVVVTLLFLAFFIPFALNVKDTLMNFVGVTVIVALVIGLIAMAHKKLTRSSKE